MPRLSHSSDDALPGSAATITYTLGELAKLLDVAHDRVETWARNGWLVGTGHGQGPGHYRAFSQTELEVARRALRIAKRYGVTVTEPMFEESRRTVREA